MYKILPKFNKSKVYKTKINPNSREFYKKHPDLAPRNVYLYMGRTLDLKTVHKYLDNIGKESIFERIKNWFSNLFNKKK
ncbi:hypothetical protein J6R97_00970 [bacterium]|jgi:hypothetical protein|nr:hypothetical protein [bacterium]